MMSSGASGMKKGAQSPGTPKESKGLFGFFKKANNKNASVHQQQQLQHQQQLQQQQQSTGIQHQPRSEQQQQPFTPQLHNNSPPPAVPSKDNDNAGPTSTMSLAPATTNNAAAPSIAGTHAANGRKIIAKPVSRKAKLQQQQERKRMTMSATDVSRLAHDHRMSVIMPVTSVHSVDPNVSAMEVEEERSQQRRQTMLVMPSNNITVADKLKKNALTFKFPSPPQSEPPVAPVATTLVESNGSANNRLSMFGRSENVNDNRTSFLLDMYQNMDRDDDDNLNAREDQHEVTIEQQNTGTSPAVAYLEEGNDENDHGENTISSVSPSPSSSKKKYRKSAYVPDNIDADEDDDDDGLEEKSSKEEQDALALKKKRQSTSLSFESWATIVQRLGSESSSTEALPSPFADAGQKSLMDEIMNSLGGQESLTKEVAVAEVATPSKSLSTSSSMSMSTLTEPATAAAAAKSDFTQRMVVTSKSGSSLVINGGALRKSSRHCPHRVRFSGEDLLISPVDEDHRDDEPGPPEDIDSDDSFEMLRQPPNKPPRVSSGVFAGPKADFQLAQQPGPVGGGAVKVQKPVVQAESLSKTNATTANRMSVQWSTLAHQARANSSVTSSTNNNNNNHHSTANKRMSVMTSTSTLQQQQPSNDQTKLAGPKAPLVMMERSRETNERERRQRMATSVFIEPFTGSPVSSPMFDALNVQSPVPAPLVPTSTNGTATSTSNDTNTAATSSAAPSSNTMVPPPAKKTAVRRRHIQIQARPVDYRTVGIQVGASSQPQQGIDTPTELDRLREENRQLKVQLAAALQQRG